MDEKRRDGREYRDGRWESGKRSIGKEEPERVNKIRKDGRDGEKRHKKQGESGQREEEMGGLEGHNVKGRKEI